MQTNAESSIRDIRCEFRSLLKAPPNADAKWKRERGKTFERIIHGLLDCEGLSPRTNYRPAGEEIDGSFIYAGRVFLLEAKWQTKKISASELYKFRGKVDGKLVGTVGVFISMSDYSKDAAEALALGKTINVILFSRDDFEICISEEGGFAKVLLTKLRRAAEQGLVFFPYKSRTVKTAVKKDIVPATIQSVTESVVTEEMMTDIPEDIIFICEGSTDQWIISYLASRIFEVKGIRRHISTVVAMGKSSIPRLAQRVHQSMPQGTRLVLVADSDGDVEMTEQYLKRGLDFEVSDLIIPHPFIESWLFRDEPEQRRSLRKIAEERGKTVQNLIKNEINRINIEGLAAENESFRRFIEVLEKRQ